MLLDAARSQVIEEAHVGHGIIQDGGLRRQRAALDTALRLSDRHNGPGPDDHPLRFGNRFLTWLGAVLDARPVRGRLV